MFSHFFRNYKSYVKKYRHRENITILSCLVHAFFITSYHSKKVSDLRDAERDKRQRKIFHCLHDSAEYAEYANVKKFCTKC